jgi:hypothetical protein
VADMPPAAKYGRVKRRKKMETGKIRDFANRPSNSVGICYVSLHF